MVLAHDARRCVRSVLPLQRKQRGQSCRAGGLSARARAAARIEDAVACVVGGVCGVCRGAGRVWGGGVGWAVSGGVWGGGGGGGRRYVKPKPGYTPKQKTRGSPPADAAGWG